jgi:hypothetical protein
MDVFQQNLLDNLLWFVISTVILVIILPIYIDWREYKNRRTVRRMIASRISRVVEMIVPYLEAGSTKANTTRENSADDLKNAIHHMMDVPEHFPNALTGKVGQTYYTFRVVSTNVAATAAIALKDYDRFFRDIFFTHAVVPLSSIRELDQAYKAALRALGNDIYAVEAMQPVMRGWKSDEIPKLEAMYVSLHNQRARTTPASLTAAPMVCEEAMGHEA